MYRLLSDREKVILWGTVTVIIFSLFFNFLLEPLLRKNEKLDKEIKITLTKLRKYTWLLSQKDYIYNKYEKFISGIDVSDAGKDNLVATLSELEMLARDANIRIIDIRPQNPRKINLYKEIVVDLKAEGDMEGYLKFIYNLENSLLLMRIKRLILNAKPNTQTLEGNFSILQLSISEGGI